MTSQMENEMVRMGVYTQRRAVASRDIGFDDGGDTGGKSRQFTDIPCLIIFLIYIGGMVYINRFSHAHGDIRKLTQGYDWQGHVCGIHDDVAARPMLFWCAKNSMRLALEDGICVSECPTSREGTHLCPDEAQLFSYESEADKNGSKIVTMGFRRQLEPRVDYPTTRVLGYCLPSDPNDRELLTQILNLASVSGYLERAFSAASAIQQSWNFLVSVAIVSVLSGYLFLLALKTTIRPFVYALSGTIALALVLGLVWFSITAFQPEHNSFSRLMVDEGKARTYSLVTAGIFLVLNVLYGLLCWKSANAIDVTVEAIKESCDVLVALPTLLLQPLVQVVLKLVAFGFTLHGLLWVVSLGELHAFQFDPYNPSDYGASGISRSFVFTSQQKWYIVVWAFGMLWILELIGALGNFAISHAVVAYKVFDTMEFLPLSMGYLNGVIYHLGSLALGSLIIGVLKAITGILSFLLKQMQTSNADDPVNKVAKLCLCCFAPCMACLTKFMQLVNELVYADICFSGANYVAGAHNVFSCMANNPVCFATMQGVTFIVRILGLSLIGGGGTFLCYKILSYSHGVDGEGSLHQPLTHSGIIGTTAASAVICCAVADCFMQIFDRTADALTYAILQKKRIDPTADIPMSWTLASGAAEEYARIDD